MNNHQSSQDPKQDNPQHLHAPHPLGTAMGWAIAAALGAALGLVFAQRNEPEVKNLFKKAQDLAGKFQKSRQEIQKIIQDAFGEVSEELEKNYLEIRGDILAKVDDLKEKGKLTKEKYEDIVNHAVQKFPQAKDWTKKSTNHLIDTLKQDWKDISKDLEEAQKNEEESSTKNKKQEENEKSKTNGRAQ